MTFWLGSDGVYVSVSTPQNTPFPDGFHTALFGRRPVSEAEEIKRRR